MLCNNVLTESTSGSDVRSSNSLLTTMPTESGKHFKKGPNVFKYRPSIIAFAGSFVFECMNCCSKPSVKIWDLSFQIIENKYILC